MLGPITNRALKFTAIISIPAFLCCFPLSTVAQEFDFLENPPWVETEEVMLDLTNQEFAEGRLGPLYEKLATESLCIGESGEPNTVDSATCEHNYDVVLRGRSGGGRPKKQFDLEVLVRGPGLIEVGIALAGDLLVDTSRFLTFSVNGYQHADAYRDVTPTPPSPEWKHYYPRVTFDEALYASTLMDYAENRQYDKFYALAKTIESLELIAVARRLEGDCAMSATVSGDINRHAFGDAAYFNIAQVPVKKGMMVGTIGETQTHEQVAGFGTVGGPESVNDALDMAASLGLIGEEERAEAQESIDEAAGGSDAPSEQGNEDFAEWAQRELRADDPSEGDNFGLNLVDIKSDVTPKDDVLAGAMLGGAFTFALSGRIDLGEFSQSGQSEPEQQNPRIRVIPSTITATVGTSTEGGDRIPFELAEDGAVAGEIVFSRQNSDYILGRFAVELETKGVYNLEGVVRQGTGVVAADEPRKLRIGVQATFAARRGSLSCMK